MEELHQLETVVALLAAVLVLATAARRVLIPYPIFLVLGGLVIGVLPRVPVVRLDPDIVFLIFLPPVLFSAAYFTSLRDFRANLRPITLLAVGLVLATTAVVAAVARVVIPGLSWPAAIALGAIVSPPDAVAASAIARRLGIPFRIVTVLEGESLINDAAALVLYRSAVAAVVTGAFSLSQTLWQFVLTAAGGVLIGLIVGAGVCWALRLTEDSLIETAITLLAPYAAWILAERTQTSGVLACVAGGLYVRQFFSAAVAPATRMQGSAVWRLLIFGLNGVIFAWIGLRGIVSLAAALALPVTTATGAPFPYRDEIILVTFAVILATLVVQGLTLTPLIRFLDLGEDRTLELEETRAREDAAKAALARLDELASVAWARREDIERLRAVYTQRVRRASPIELGADAAAAKAQAAFRRLRHEILSAERRVLIARRDQGVISDEILLRLEQELDVEAMRIGLGETRLDDRPGV